MASTATASWPQPSFTPATPFVRTWSGPWDGGTGSQQAGGEGAGEAQSGANVLLVHTPAVGWSASVVGVVLGSTGFSCSCKAAGVCHTDQPAHPVLPSNAGLHQCTSGSLAWVLQLPHRCVAPAIYAHVDLQAQWLTLPLCRAPRPLLLGTRPCTPVSQLGQQQTPCPVGCQVCISHLHQVIAILLVFWPMFGLGGTGGQESRHGFPYT
jgi:hypothetical protein